LIVLSGGIILEEAVDLSSDRLLMNEYGTHICSTSKGSGGRFKFVSQYNASAQKQKMWLLKF
jgi:hypothetical protein